MTTNVALGAAVLCLTAILPSSAQIDLAIDGKAQSTIVLGATATQPERTAARELATYLQKITGAEFPVTDKAPKTGQRIFVGQTPYARRLLFGFDWSGLKHDGIVIRTVGKDLILVGDRPRGSIYAVESFLEDQLGVRWWATDAEFVPSRSTLSIGNLDIVYKPPFMYREAYYQPMNTPDAALPMHLKLNGHFQQIPADMGGHYSIIGFCHTFYQILPPEKYFGEHPDWYSEIGGKRTSQWAQLCLTNPEMKKEFVKQALARIAQDPGAGIISVTQNDCANACQCPACKKLVEETGGESGALITFVNSVAEEIEKQYPDFLVETLAYQYTRHAPTSVRPRRNVIVRLCSIECNFGQPLDSKANAAFKQDLDAWKKIAERLYVWDYTVNFANSLIPHPNIHNLAANIRTFASSNVVGLFEQGDAFNKSTSFNPLKAWLLAKLMWNPQLDSDALIEEFTDGYYGPAGKHMRTCIEALTDAVRREKPSLICFCMDQSFYSARDLQRAWDAMNLAVESVKDDKTLLDRVLPQKASIERLIIQTRRSLAAEGQSVQRIDWEAAPDEFLKLADTYGNSFGSEGAPIDDVYRTRLHNQVILPKARTNVAPPASGKEWADWVDIQEDRFSFFNEGVWVTVTTDDAASDGLACAMPGSSSQWAIQHVVQPKDIIAPKVDITCRIRVDATGQDGMAVRLGVYNPEAQVDNFREFPLSEVKDSGYYDYRLPGVALAKGMYIYVAPCANQSVREVYIDRIYLTKPGK